MGRRSGTLTEREGRQGKFIHEEVVQGISGDSVALSTQTDVSIVDIAGAAGNVLVLGDGVPGQRKVVHARSQGGAGDAVITPTNLHSGTTVTLDAARETAEFTFVDGAWAFVGGDGVLA